MKHWRWILAGLVVVGGIALVGTSRAQILLGSKTQPPQPPAVEPRPLPVLPQSDLGPGAQGAQLRLPGQDAPAPVQPLPPRQPQGYGATPAYVQQMLPAKSGAYPGANSPPIKKERVAEPPSDRFVNYNKDIEITENAGPFAIFVMGYTGKNIVTGEEAPEMARKFVRELYTNPQYTQHKLRAYVFNYGAEEKKKEFERVEKLRRDRAEQLKNLPHSDAVLMPRIRAVKIDEQTAVLFGGYNSREEAERALAKIKQLPIPDPKKVDMDVAYLGDLQRDQEGNVVVNGAIQNYHGYGYVNPFTRAFVTRNPSVKQTGAGDIPAEDVAFLKRINEREPLSLFQCKHRFTLTVKQFNTQYQTVDAKGAKEFFARLDRELSFVNLLKKKGDWQDNAAHNAHNLAEALRKSGLPETYVLHSRNCSFVTVGGYDDLRDPRLEQMQQFLASHFRADAYRQLEMMPVPAPMLVPR